MNDDRHDDAMQAGPELDGLRALRREEDPGRLLEERTVRALRGRGLLAVQPRAFARPWAWAAAAAVAFFVIGFALGRGTGDGGEPRAQIDPRPLQNLAASDAPQPGGAGEQEITRVTSSESTQAAADRYVVWF